MQPAATAAQTYFQFVTMAIEPHASSDSTRFAKPVFKPIRLTFKTACCRRRRACVRRGRVCAPCANAASPRSVLLDASDRVHSRRARRRTPKITQKIPAEPIVAPKKNVVCEFFKRKLCHGRIASSAFVRRHVGSPGESTFQFFEFGTLARHFANRLCSTSSRTSVGGARDGGAAPLARVHATAIGVRDGSAGI